MNGYLIVQDSLNVKKKYFVTHLCDFIKRKIYQKAWKLSINGAIAVSIYAVYESGVQLRSQKT